MSQSDRPEQRAQTPALQKLTAERQKERSEKNLPGESPRNAFDAPVRVVQRWQRYRDRAEPDQAQGEQNRSKREEGKYAEQSVLTQPECADGSAERADRQCDRTLHGQQHGELGVRQCPFLPVELGLQHGPQIKRDDIQNQLLGVDNCQGPQICLAYLEGMQEALVAQGDQVPLEVDRGDRYQGRQQGESLGQREHGGGMPAQVGGRSHQGAQCHDGAGEAMVRSQSMPQPASVVPSHTEIMFCGGLQSLD